MNDDRDPIIDACLEEVLGDSKPPDVLKVVLREWSRLQDSSLTDPSIPEASITDEPILPVPLLPPVCKDPPVTVAVQRSPNIGPSGTERLGARGERRAVPWLLGASILALLIVALALNLVRSNSRQEAPQTAEQRTPATGSVRQPSDSIPSSKRMDQPRAPQVARQPGPSRQDNSPMPIVNPDIANSESPSPGFSIQDTSTIERLIAVTPIPAPASDREVVRVINSGIRLVWSRSSLAPGDFISDDTWFQRVFQVIIGREPTAEETAKRPAKLHEQQREQLVADLMHSEKYIEEFARHWSELLTRTFLADDLVAEASLANREGMLQYFRRALLDGVPFDQVVEEMLTATGAGIPGHPEYNGAANFLLARAGGRFEQATADTSRLFLGRNVECLQCHDDFDQRGRQSEFWELNSFFRQLAVVRNDTTNAAHLDDVDFLGEDRKDGRSAVVFFEQPDGVLKSAFPAFSGQPDLPRSGLITETNRRTWLAKCVTASPQFRQAITNRIWEDVYGIGLAPSDDLAGAEATSPILKTVADQLAAHQYNFRKVISWAVLSEPFAMPASDSATALAMQSSRSFHRFLGQRSTPHRPVHQSLLAVAKSFDQPAASNAATTAKVESAPITDVKNGKLALQGAAPTPLLNAGQIPADPIAKRFLANGKLSNPQKAQHLFQLVLHRHPRRRELEVIEKLLEKAGSQPESAWDSIWTALQNSAP